MKMTESMKSEVVRLYFEENREEAEIAARLGISLRQAKTVLGDLARLETYKKRSEAAKLRAQICVNKSAEEAARRQAALLLDGVSGGLAGAIGLALADILAGDPGYAITTFVLKFIIGITCGAVAHKVFKLRDQDRHSAGYLVKVIVSAGSGLLLNVFTDPFLGYFRNVYIFGQEYTVAQALTKIAGGVTFVNSVASTACAVVLYLALRPALERAKLLSKGE